MRTDGTGAGELERIDALEKAVSQSPAFRSGYFHLGCAYLQRGYHLGARGMLEKAYKLEPSDPMCNFLLSQLYTEELDLLKARLHLERSEAVTGRAATKQQRALRYEHLKLAPVSLASSREPDVKCVSGNQDKPQTLWQWLFSSKKIEQ
jgi:tetratricopeptide (TPR) repeat protein